MDILGAYSGVWISKPRSAGNIALSSSYLNKEGRQPCPSFCLNFRVLDGEIGSAEHVSSTSLFEEVDRTICRLSFVFFELRVRGRDLRHMALSNPIFEEESRRHVV